MKLGSSPAFLVLLLPRQAIVFCLVEPGLCEKIFEKEKGQEWMSICVSGVRGSLCLRALGLWLDRGRQPGVELAFGKGGNPEAEGVSAWGFQDRKSIMDFSRKSPKICQGCGGAMHGIYHLSGSQMKKPLLSCFPTIPENQQARGSSFLMTRKGKWSARETSLSACTPFGTPPIWGILFGGCRE